MSFISSFQKETSKKHCNPLDTSKTQSNFYPYITEKFWPHPKSLTVSNDTMLCHYYEFEQIFCLLQLQDKICSGWKEKIQRPVTITTLIDCNSDSMRRFVQFGKRNIPPWRFFTFFKLYKRYHIAQSIIYKLTLPWASISLKKVNKSCI